MFYFLLGSYQLKRAINDLIDVFDFLNGYTPNKSDENIIILKFVNIHSRYQILVLDVEKLKQMKLEKKKKNRQFNQFTEWCIFLV